MRICVLTLDFPPFRSSGLTIYAERLVTGLAARGHALTVVASVRPEQRRVEEISIEGDVRVVRVPIHRMDWIGFGWEAARYLRAHRSDFDLVHFADIHFAYAYRGAFVATGLQSFRQRLTSSREWYHHVGWRSRLFRLAYYHCARRLMERPAVQRATHVIMVSGTTQREFIQHYGLDPARTTLIHIGIDLHRFDALPEQVQARRQLGLPEDEAILLYVGFSTPRKGLEYLAQAWKSMETRSHLVMVGKWERHYQERFLHTLGGPHACVHITGYVLEADLSLYYAAADVFVLPSLLEGFGIPLVEAMAAGLPVVTTTGSAAEEIVGDAGLVVAAGDSNALAAALDRVLLDPTLAEQMRRKGRQRARASFGQEHFICEIEAVYRRFLDTVHTL